MPVRSPAQGSDPAGHVDWGQEWMSALGQGLKMAPGVDDKQSVSVIVAEKGTSTRSPWTGTPGLGWGGETHDIFKPPTGM